MELTVASIFLELFVKFSPKAHHGKTIQLKFVLLIVTILTGRIHSNRYLHGLRNTQKLGCLSSNVLKHFMSCQINIFGPDNGHIKQNLGS